LLNETPKVVVSESLQNVTETKNWHHVSLINKDIRNNIINLKKQKGGDIILLASSNFCVSLLEWGLLDEIRIMINPVVIGEGTQLFHGLKNKVGFKLTDTRNFASGNILLSYLRE
jgi:dihydrofolate reductase